jgi:GTP cyclohydrolase I
MNPAVLAIVPELARDVQAEPDPRGITIERVGIRGLRYPIRVIADNEPQSSIAEWELTVELGGELRGTHMSRFLEGLERWGAEPFDGARVMSMLADIRERLDARRADARCTFTLFLERRAPVSGQVSRLGIDCSFEATSDPDSESESLRLGVRVPVTTLCPCSKEISEYGAHNQRGYVDIKARVVPSADITFEELVEVAESSASAPIHPLLKRVDERYVTMQAYDAPAFVEDVVRSATEMLSGDSRVLGLVVDVENHESIHDHSAVATVRWERSCEPESK